MTRLVMEGTDWLDLETQLNAWYKPGARLQLDIGLPRDLSTEELAIVQQRLLDEGLQLLAPLEVGTGNWDNTLRIKFKNPAGFASPALPLAVLIILAVGMVGIGTILGWRVGEVFSKYFPAIAVLTVATILGWAYITKR